LTRVIHNKPPKKHSQQTSNQLMGNQLKKILNQEPYLLGKAVGV